LVQAGGRILYKLHLQQTGHRGGLWRYCSGIIMAMAADYRISINNPKIKVGMTEIKLGLSLPG
jgi:hypothetical protein